MPNFLMELIQRMAGGAANPMRPPAKLRPPTKQPRTNPMGGGLQGAITRHIAELPDYQNVQSTGTGYHYVDPMTGIKMYGGGPEMATPKAERRHYRGLSG